MGICCSKEIRHIKPETSELIKTSTISKLVKLESIQKRFEFIKVIGYGVYGTVREAIKLSGSFNGPMQKRYAIKSVTKSKVEAKLEVLQRELQILKTVDHPNIIKLYEVYEDKKYMHLVTELCTGGDLLDYLLRKVVLSEEEVLVLIYKALSAISHLHSLNICHRDIKPENFLLYSDDPGSELKLVDFGMSNFVGVDGLNTFAGTPYYIAPEVIEGSYSKECDIWSLGVLMFFLLSGQQPFHSSSVSAVFQNIVEGNYDFSHVSWQNVSENSKDLIKRMLVVQPELRITLSEALNHDVFKDLNTKRPIQLQIFNSLKKFKAPSKLWGEAMLIFVKNFSIDQISSLKAAFDEIDVKKSGFITANDIISAMQMNKYDIAYHEFLKMIENVQYLGKGKLNYSQFLIAAMDRKKELNEEQLWDLFKYFDSDDNGKITLDEFKYTLEKAICNASDKEIEEIVEEFKLKAQDSMSFDMFLDLMRCVTEEAGKDSEGFRTSRRISVPHHYTALIRKSTMENVFSVNSVS